MYKNKIIALSGQPVTGKGTTVKALSEKLTEQGYLVHVISTGHEFRNYFNSISEFIKHYQNEEKIEDLSKNQYLSLFLEKKEYRQVLIDTILELKQNNIDTNNLSIEQANNLKEFSRLRKVVDQIIDMRTKEIIQEFDSEERPNEALLVDSRMAGILNKENVFSVRLTSTPEVAAQRLFNDTTRGKEDNKYKSVKEAFEARENRRIGEQKRYIKRYGEDLEDENHYNLIIDTSYSTIDDISDTILTCLDCYTKGEEFSKKWASPKTFLPLQSDMKTMKQGESGYNLEEIERFIKENGYLPNEPIEVVDVDEYKYIIEGHHRNFASAHIGKTLVPYKIIATEDEILPEIYRQSETESARDRVKKELNKVFVQNHEYFIGENFSYGEIYPDIYTKLLKEKEQEQR